MTPPSRKAVIKPEGGKETEEKCSFPDCGCPCARLCYWGKPNDGALAVINPERPMKRGPSK